MTQRPWFEEEGAVPLPARRRAIGTPPDYRLLDTYDLGALSDERPENDAEQGVSPRNETDDLVVESDAAGILPPAAPRRTSLRSGAGKENALETPSLQGPSVRAKRPSRKTEPLPPSGGA